MRKLLLALLTAAAILAILAGGCASKATDSSKPPSSVPALKGQSLAGTSWVLASYGDPANLKSVIAGTKITLTFSDATDQITGNGGVNGYGGFAQRTDNQLTFSGILHTAMASTDQAVNEQESAYFALLSAARSVEFGGIWSLTINCAGGQVLVFSAVER
ncbi:MAG: META domain-containing protein [Dehalococcoidia bacterium]|nr:MAG: META domain-containing protein [Dehalococcoidia bacterium]